MQGEGCWGLHPKQEEQKCKTALKGLAVWLPLAGQLLRLSYGLQGQNTEWYQTELACKFPGWGFCFFSQLSTSVPPGSMSQTHHNTLHSGKRGSCLPPPSHKAFPYGSRERRSKAPSPFFCTLLRTERTSSETKLLQNNSISCFNASHGSRSCTDRAGTRFSSQRTDTFISAMCVGGSGFPSAPPSV